MTDHDPEKMVKDLQNTGAYPEETGQVRLVQTHISWVFICDQFVYKLKKPVDFGFLDFTTLDKRRLFCQKEVELNKRLARDIYLGVYPVIFDGDQYRISPDTEDGSIQPLEYAVKMRVLPVERLMKAVFESGQLAEDDITRTARVIAEFHRTASRSAEIDKFGSLKTVKFNTDENFEQTEKYVGETITREQFNALQAWTDKFYTDNSKIFQKRIDSGRVRDCHGDLHMEHICLTEPITIFDCIEFNDRFRYSDTASDLAFLLMDLEYHGGRAFAELLYDSYLRFSGEAVSDMELVIKYYKIYRAYVRGKVNSFQLDDANITAERSAAARDTAKKYFELAWSYI